MIFQSEYATQYTNNRLTTTELARVFYLALEAEIIWQAQYDDHCGYARFELEVAAEQFCDMMDILLTATIV